MAEFLIVIGFGLIAILGLIPVIMLAGIAIGCIVLAFLYVIMIVLKIMCFMMGKDYEEC